MRLVIFSDVLSVIHASFGKVRHNSRIDSSYRARVRRITRSAMYEKSSTLLAGKCLKKNSF